MRCLWILLLLAACGEPEPASWSGYVEAEYTRLSSPVAGRLLTLETARGRTVAAGARLFVLDTEPERLAVDEARARLARNEAQAADLDKGRRADELAVVLAQERAATAAWRQAQDELLRQTRLAQEGFASGANLEALQSRRDAEAARLDEVRAQLKVARLAARDDARRAAGADIAAARAQLAQSDWKVAQKTVTAPQAAQVDDTYYQPGEWVPAGSPVVSLLSPAAVKLRFFVPQADLPRLLPGTRLRVQCDGCAAPLMARVSYVAHQAEYTPPVLYSRENRAKLVFLVEAVPEKPAQLLPGQPVDLSLAAP